MSFKSKNLVIFISWLGLCFLWLILYTTTTPHEGSDSPTCRMSYMNPSYARIKTFDESYSKFASKYSLYLYREQDQDSLPSNDGEIGLTGIPILFIPGNAGSFRQVRAIAAETSNVYFEMFKDNIKRNPNSRNYDYFTADFNEDYPAFHGRTMLDQAEYLNEAIKFILQLYKTSDVPPKSVVILAHSMGGIVARVMVTLPNYTPDSINTIITLSSPHAAAPLTFDGDILKLYSNTDRFWYDGFSNNSQIAHQLLKNISLISITGGMLDDVLPADYTTLGFLVPPSNGFTVFSTGIPQVWTPIDHLAIVWCSQLRHKLALMLLNIADYSQPSKTYSLDKRMKVFRDHLLTGFENETVQDKKFNQPNKDTFNLKLDNNQITHFDDSNFLKIDQRDNRPRKNLHVSMFKLPQQRSNYKFSVISAIPFTVWKEFFATKFINPSILICSENSTVTHELFDLSSSDENMLFECIDITEDQRNVPLSKQSTESLDESSFGGDHSTFYAFDIDCETLKGYDSVIIADRLNIDSPDEDFLVGQITSKKEYELKGDLSQLVLFGSQVIVPSYSDLVTNIHIPGAWSSLLSYRLKISQVDDDDSSFSPIIRQFSSEPYETKWHINLRNHKEISLSTHGIAPFTPFKVSSNPKDKGMSIDIWSDIGSKSGTMEISITIDFLSSLRLLIIRYRLALVASCVLIMLFVMTTQLRYYLKTKKYPPLTVGLQSLTSIRNFTIICLLLSILTPMVKIPTVQRILNFIDPVVIRDSNEINLSPHHDFKLNSFYLGLEEDFLFIIGPIFFIIGIGLIHISYYLLLMIGAIISKIIIQANKYLTFRSSNNEKLKNESPILLSPQIEGNENSFSQTLWKYRRYLLGILVILLIPIYLPYQFVFIVCCIVQAFKVLRILINQYHTKENYDNILNYNVSFLILMLWILPINVPILIVFVHNLAVNWKTPFSSHHNMLSIIPIIFLIEKHTRMEVLPKFGNSSSNMVIKMIIWYCYYCIFYCVIYGVRHTYWIHHLFNILSFLILFLFFENEFEQEKPTK